MLSMQSSMSSRLPQHFLRARPRAKLLVQACLRPAASGSERHHAWVPLQNLSKWFLADLRSLAEDSFHAALVGSATALGRLSGCGVSKTEVSLSSASICAGLQLVTPYWCPTFFPTSCQVPLPFLWEAAVPDLQGLSIVISCDRDPGWFLIFIKESFKRSGSSDG